MRGNTTVKRRSDSSNGIVMDDVPDKAVGIPLSINVSFFQIGVDGREVALQLFAEIRNIFRIIGQTSAGHDDNGAKKCYYLGNWVVHNYSDLTYSFSSPGQTRS